MSDLSSIWADATRERLNTPLPTELFGPRTPMPKRRWITVRLWQIRAAVARVLHRIATQIDDAVCDEEQA